MSPTQTPTTATYQCLCEVAIGFALTGLEFQAFSSTGQKGDRVKVERSAHLPLPDASGNTVEIAYWNVTWQSLGCYSPIGNGDTIKVDGSSSNLAVTVNGHPVSSGNCPQK